MKPGRMGPIFPGGLFEGMMRRIMLAGGLGAIVGFQAWRLAQDGFPVPMPWFLALVVFGRHLALGLAIGATSPSIPWWQRGCALGALFSLPSAIGLFAGNSRLAPLAVALCAAGMAAGIIIALLTDLICPQASKRSGDRETELRRTAVGIQRRLAEGKARLEDIDSARLRLHEPALRRMEEAHIIWNELLELELQDIDEHVSRLRGSSPNPRRPGRS